MKFEFAVLKLFMINSQNIFFVMEIDLPFKIDSFRLDNLAAKIVIIFVQKFNLGVLFFSPEVLI